MKLFADLLSIPLVKLLPQKSFCWLVYANIKWLQSVRAICRNPDYMNVVLFKELLKTLCSLASELVKDHQGWVVRLEFKFFSLSNDVREEDIRDVLSLWSHWTNDCGYG